MERRVVYEYVRRIDEDGNAIPPGDHRYENISPDDSIHDRDDERYLASVKKEPKK